ncbi:MAG: hypothetical protein ACK5P3_22510, partial [Dolichospermum sp.]
VNPSKPIRNLEILKKVKLESLDYLIFELFAKIKRYQRKLFDQAKLIVTALPSVMRYKNSTHNPLPAIDEGGICTS